MGLPPGIRSTHPPFPSPVVKDVASRSRAGDGRFTFTALVKSMRCASFVAGASPGFVTAAGVRLVASCESCLSCAVVPTSTPRLAHRDNAQPVGNDMEPPQCNLTLRTVALRGRTGGAGNLALFAGGRCSAIANQKPSRDVVTARLDPATIPS